MIVYWKTILLLEFLKSLFIVILDSGRSLTSRNIKCISLNNEPCLAKPKVINLNPDELHYSTFMIDLNKCGKNCNTLDYAPNRLCVTNTREDVDVKIFKIMPWLSDS